MGGTRHIGIDERRARVGRRHHLAAPAPALERVVTDLVGLHSSDPVTVYLSCRARLDGFERSDLEAALYDRRTLVRMLGMRRTLFVVPIDVAAAMDAACARALAPPERRRLIGYLEDQGLAADGATWLEDVEAKTLATLGHLGEATGTELRNEVEELALQFHFGAGKKWGGPVGVSTRVLFLLATEGRIVRGRPRGTWRSSQYRWSETATWLGAPLPHLDLEVAAVDLARRWLRSYGPASVVDLKWWTGWTMTRTRATLEAMGAVEVDLDDGTGYVDADDLMPVAAPGPWVTFLPSLDSTVMGWKERDWYLGEHRTALFDVNGNAGPTIWANGKVVGGWAQRPTGEVAYRILEDVGAEAAAAIEAEAARVTTWIGEHRITPRFRGPLDLELSR